MDRDFAVRALEGEVYAGCDRAAALGRPLSEVTSAADWAELRPRCEAALAGSPQSFRLHSATRSGAWEVRVSLTRAIGPDAGSPTGIMLFLEEVGEGRRRDIGEDRPWSFVEALSEGVLVASLDGGLAWANDAARRILGHPLDPGRGDEDWWLRLDARHPDGTALTLRSPGEEVVRTGVERDDVPVHVLRGDGTRRHLCLNYRLIADAVGGTPGLVISFHDVTDAETERERLAAAETRLRDAHELAALASWEWDVHRDRVFILQGLPGQLEERVETGAGIDALLTDILPHDREAIAAAIDAFRDGDGQSSLLRYRYRLGDGQVRWVETRMRAVHDGGGELVRVCGTTQDVTESHVAAAELEDARDFLQATLDSLPGHVAVLDSGGDVIAVNAGWARYGRDRPAERARPGVGSNYLAACDSFTGSEEAARAAAGIRAIIAGSDEGFSLDYAIPSEAGTRWFNLRADPHRSDGPVQIVLQHTEITEQRRAAQDASVRAQLLDQVNAAIVAIDRDGTLTLWSRGAETLYGWTADEMVGTPSADVSIGTDLEASAEENLRAIMEEGSWHGRFDMRRKDGTRFPADMRATALHDEAGDVSGVLAIAIDVTDRVRDERDLRSARDYMRAVTDGISQGMCTLDADDRVVYLNPAAEQILGWPAEALLGKVFRDEVQADGDTFVASDGRAVPVDCSVSEFMTPEGVRGTVLLFSDVTERKQREAVMHRDLDDLSWVMRINEAIERDRFTLFAQPIVDLATGATVQRELLIRMLDEEGALIAPGSFLAAAERSGLIREIDLWVVRRAAALSAAGHAVELNISADSLGDPDFAVTVERELSMSGADCSRMVIELTETALLRDEDAGRRFIGRVQGLGCQVALDDFGTGYGGFTYLKHLELDFLKIDREFVRDLPRNAASRHVVSAVVALARDFGLRTIAEGVEDAATLSVLRRHGVDYGQGFHLGRPAPIDETL